MLLAVEMSGPRNTLALDQDAGVTKLDFSDARGKGLMPALERLLAEADATRHDLRGIVVGVGPGSYTGLRIACSAGIMLSYALEIPCGGLVSFAAAAFAQDLQDQDLHLVLDAYRKEVYHACYRREGESLRVVQSPQVLPMADAAAAVGDGSYLGEPRFAADGVAKGHDCQASADDLLAWAQALGVTREGQGFDGLEPVEPLYLRPAAFRRPAS